MRRHRNYIFLFLTTLALAASLVWGAPLSPGQEPEEPEFFIHEFHATLLTLDCST